MADNSVGLLGGVGAGLQSFTDTYLRAKQLNQQNQLENTKLGLLQAETDAKLKHQSFEEGREQSELEMTQKSSDLQNQERELGIAKTRGGLISSGYTQDESGHLVPGQGLMAPKKFNDEMADPNSQTSQQIFNHIKQTAGKYGENVPAGLSGLQYQKIYGEDAVNLAKAKMQGDAQMNKAMIFAGPKQEQVNLAKDRMTSQAVDEVTKDKPLQNSVQRVQGAKRIKSQLDEVRAGKIVDTNQLLSDLNTEYVNLLTGSNSSALGKLERTEYRTYAGDLANLIQKIKGSPESVKSPEIMKQLETSVDSLENVYRGQVNTRAKQLQRTYAHNPDATKAQQDKIQEMIGDYGGPAQSPGLLGGAGSASTAPMQGPAPQPTPHSMSVGATMNVGGKTYVKTQQGWVEQNASK